MRAANLVWLSEFSVEVGVECLWPSRGQADTPNQVLCGHYAYYSPVGNIGALQRVHRAVETLLAHHPQWSELEGQGQPMKARFPIGAIKAYLPTRSYKLSRCRVKQLLTSVVLEIWTLRSGGVLGAGNRPQPPGDR